ncbi:LANO_0A02740g1_1 [Lachancea nothofagi CBS 11611]|uniref:LANO_0A02740g1_1 n=1 Tax=Lachancea nothofagi CBS 11611 TaxID=1266666 RepID=A0A1G4INT6_9SACH|nr:LANO_0A02740g1_1 [Lachancea nothofagi CBS 11611]
MTTLLSNYESEFKNTLQQSKTLLSVAPTQPVSQRNSTLQEVEQQQDELLDLIDQMDIEVNNGALEVQSRSAFKAKLRDYKKQVHNDVKAPLQQLTDSRNRDLLFQGVPGADGLPQDGGQRQQMLSNHAILSRTGDKLRDATRTAVDTENVGSQVMMDLRAQRETLENARQTLFQADSYVDKSIRTLKTMSRRLVANKFISYAIIAVLIILILLVLFAKFK